MGAHQRLRVKSLKTTRRSWKRQLNGWMIICPLRRKNMKRSRRRLRVLQTQFFSLWLVLQEEECLVVCPVVCPVECQVVCLTLEVQQEEEEHPLRQNQRVV